MSNPLSISRTSSLDNEYIGRFAPSPTGPLHFGSLIAAVASYLDAKANQGRWLVRMEDLDPPRESPGAAALILRQLELLGLCWDGEVLYQSNRLEAYENTLAQLKDRKLCFDCDCTRPQVREMGNVYDGTCRRRNSAPENNFAVRVKTEPIDIGINDLVQGRYSQNLNDDVGDFIIKRKDTLIAYQLAVVVDDDHQNITHIIRGFDLIDSTPRQIFLQRLLGFEEPIYGHVPIIVNNSGQKLSKQHFAAAIDVSRAPLLLHRVLTFLGQSPPLGSDITDPRDQLQWGIENWDIQAVPKLATIPEDQSA